MSKDTARRDDSAQSQRFIDIAQEVETKQDRSVFENLLKKVLNFKKMSGKQKLKAQIKYKKHLKDTE